MGCSMKVWLLFLFLLEMALGQGCGNPPLGDCGGPDQDRYYFNTNAKSCRHFTYTGCPGGIWGHPENMYDTLEECQTACEPATTPTKTTTTIVTTPTPTPTPTVDICGLPLDTGASFMASDTERWFHNSTSKTCTTFTYAGYGGNANNFLSEAECIDTCVTTFADIGSGNTNESFTYITSSTSMISTTTRAVSSSTTTPTVLPSSVGTTSTTYITASRHQSSSSSSHVISRAPTTSSSRSSFISLDPLVTRTPQLTITINNPIISTIQLVYIGVGMFAFIIIIGIFLGMFVALKMIFSKYQRGSHVTGMGFPQLSVTNHWIYRKGSSSPPSPTTSVSV